MPSAATLVSEGYDLQQMDAKILAQVEWLWQHRVVLIGVLLGLVSVAYGQPDTITIGFGGYEAVSVSTSHNDGDTDGGSTLDFDGYLPNENSAARFLSQATVGYDVAEIQNVAAMGLEDWIDSQVAMPLVTSMEDITEAYRQYVIAQTSDNGTRSRYWRYAWWQYHMTEWEYTSPL